MAGLYGVVGYPVKHSLSPAMFKAAFWEYDMDDSYEQFEVPPEELESFAKGRVLDEPISGLSVTIPHKEKIMGMLDSVDKHARAIGAVNTVLNDGGKLKGLNTDCIGARKAIEEVVDVNGREVVVVGAGGAAAAVVYACAEMGARVTILNRSVERAEFLAERFGGESENVFAGSLDDILHHPAHLLVHTTSVGMGADVGRSLVPEEYFRRGMFVFDIVYTPMETQLLKEAARNECRTIPGYKMLLYQGEKQFEIWFGKRPRTEKMEEALLEALR